MEITKKLEELISHYEERLDVANVQLMNEYSKGWYREKKQMEDTIRFFTNLLEIAKKDEKKSITNGIQVGMYGKPHRPGMYVPHLCYSNYRCMLFLNRNTNMIDPIFWTPELGIDNSHHELWKYAMMHFRNDKGAPIYDSDYRWGGFYTYGLGNMNQRELTLYGESCDYPHNEYSEEIKRCFLEERQFFPELSDNEDDEKLPF